MKASPEQKQRMIDLIKEIRDIILSIPDLKTQEDKIRAARRMETIKAEMLKFRREFPND